MRKSPCCPSQVEGKIGTDASTEPPAGPAHPKDCHARPCRGAGRMPSAGAPGRAMPGTVGPATKAWTSPTSPPPQGWGPTRPHKAPPWSWVSLEIPLANPELSARQEGNIIAGPVLNCPKPGECHPYGFFPQSPSTAQPKQITARPVQGNFARACAPPSTASTDMARSAMASCRALTGRLDVPLGPGARGSTWQHHLVTLGFLSWGFRCVAPVVAPGKSKGNQL